MCETEVKGTVESQIKKRSLTSYRHSTGKLISKDLKDNTDRKFSLQVVTEFYTKISSSKRPNLYLWPPWNPFTHKSLLQGFLEQNLRDSKMSCGTNFKLFRPYIHINGGYAGSSNDRKWPMPLRYRFLYCSLVFHSQFHLIWNYKRWAVLAVFELKKLSLGTAFQPCLVTKQLICRIFTMFGLG